MAKFNIEVELDWIEDYETGVDDILKEEVIKGIQERLVSQIESDASTQISKKVSEKVESSIDEFLKNITSDRIEKILIPHKKDSWSSEVEMIPISEYIGQRFQKLVTEEQFDGRGNKYDRYNRDYGGPYSMVEYLTKGYIANELNEKIIKMIQQAKTQAEQTLISSLEENLQQQLNADMLKRLNIPALLENLQNTISIEGDK